MFDIFRSKNKFVGNPASLDDENKSLNNALLARTFLCKTSFITPVEETVLEITDPFVLAVNVENFLYHKNSIAINSDTKSLLRKLLEALMDEIALFTSLHSKRYYGMSERINDNERIKTYLKDLVGLNSELFNQLNKEVPYEDLQQFKQVLGLAV